MVAPTRDDVIYAAGFFDGEGCVNITRTLTPANESHIYLQIVVINTNQPVLEWLQERWGGKIYQAPTNRSILTDNPQGCWRLYWAGRAAGAVLKEWLPFLKVKREITENALALQVVKEQARRIGGRRTPSDLRAQQERLFLIHRSLSSREYKEAGISAVLTAHNEADDQMVLLGRHLFRD